MGGASLAPRGSLGRGGGTSRGGGSSSSSNDNRGSSRDLPALRRHCCIGSAANDLPPAALHPHKVWPRTGRGAGWPLAQPGVSNLLPGAVAVEHVPNTRQSSGGLSWFPDGDGTTGATSRQGGPCGPTRTCSLAVIPVVLTHVTCACGEGERRAGSSLQQHCAATGAAAHSSRAHPVLPVQVMAVTRPCHAYSCD